MINKIILILFFTVGLFAFGQTFSFSRIQVYEFEKLTKDTVVTSKLEIIDDKIILELNLKRYEYDIEDGDGIIYILKDRRNNTVILSLEKNVCTIDDRKRILILKS